MKKLYNQNYQISCPEFILDPNQIQEELDYEQIFNENWRDIQQFLVELHLNQVQVDSNVSYHLIYETIVDICQSDQSEKLNKKLVEFFEQYFTKILEPFNNIQESRQDEFLGKIEDIWKKTRQSIELLTQIFKYYETTYLIKSNTQTFESFIISQFGQQFNKFTKIKEITNNYLLKLIQDRRQKIQINENQLRLLTEMFIALDLYGSVFEVQFLEQTKKYYKDISDKLEEQFDIFQFLPQVQHILEQEQELIEKFLSKQTVEQIDYLKKSWREAIKKEGIKIINDENKKEITNNLLKFISNLDQIMFKCFQQNKILQNHQKYAIEDVLYQKVNELAELTCKHIDSKLTKSNKSIQEEDNIKADIDEALQLFKYLPSKDIFEAFFNKRLIKRLLMQMSYSTELEEQVIEKLKKECGESYTKKAEELLMNVKAAKETQKEFEDFLEKKGQVESAKFINIYILSSAAWPNENKPIPYLNEPFLGLQQKVNEFYKVKNSSATLFWQYQLSTVDITGNFDKKYTFVVSLEQAVVLFLFNEKPEWTYEEIGEKLQIEDKDQLKEILISLFAMKSTQQILKKLTGEPKKFQGQDVFAVNNDYTNKKIRVKVNTVQKKETQEQINNVMQRVLSDRQYVIDASIVKIMKLKKKLTHQELSQEIFLDLKLPLEKQEIKTRIEALIDRDFLERDQNDRATYHYKA
ncbi:Cullin repeat-like-containing domain [Pseudocohnilembus persalinus]|uniref:Cullin repeat-like-containing domain n=1 Tax=Pseudocohnilembus persalinus TaxID=266149 RepID=A0A0V0QJU5_PSEPJ|nr:Cullin repeat-like-containing domain [Pseudocohnilembus persalinus]|eukprot:KRX02579.1 Cullin repeat-like-containing domain [Pseudocohnilembus persalinus]